MKHLEPFGKKITTEDCVNAICELLYHQGEKGDSLNPKNWKRKSKSGTDIIVREFENTVTKQKMIVSETNGQIFRIVEDKAVPSKVTIPSKQITVKDVMDWADEFEEDPIIDGPVYMKEKDEEEFMKSLPKKFIEKGEFFDGWYLGSLKYEEESDNDELVKLWVDFLNLKEYKNGYKEMMDETKGIVIPVDDLSSDFPYVYKFDFAIVYSRDKLDKWQFRDETEEIEDENYTPDKISSGTRIGTIDAGDNDIKSIIVFTSDSVFFNNGDGMTNDGISYFQLSKNVHYVPAQEPIDVMDDWDGIGLYDKNEKQKIELSAKKYKLNHLLLSM